MLKKTLLFFVLVYCFLLASNFKIIYSQEIKIEKKDIKYDLPYPGILPDNPLYFLKEWRDKILDFTTRDNLKKANLYLLFSDKRANMVFELAQKGKWNLAKTTMLKAEKYFVKIPSLVEKSKKQGVSADGNFILDLKLSNEKHKEIIETLIKDVSFGEKRVLEEILKINKEIKDKLSPL